MTIEKMIERTKIEFKGIDEQIRALNIALRAEVAELKASLAQATAARKDKAATFAKKVALPNMQKIEDNWRDGLYEKYQSKIDKLHQMIHNAKNLN